MPDEIDDANDLAQTHLEKSLEKHRQNADWVPRLAGLATPLAGADMEAREKVLADAGLCRACGGEIGIARLAALPVTKMCIDCARDWETECAGEIGW